MMNDLLRVLLAAADDVGRVFHHATTAEWPPGAVETFHRLGILRRSAGSLHAPCPNCREGHVEPVTIRTRPHGTSRFYISCPESLRVEVTPEMCECWEIDPAGLAGAVARLMGLKGKPQAVIPDRFWRLGRTLWPPGSGQTRDVVLAMRMHEHDGPAVAAHVGPGGRAIVLVPHHVPDERIWPGTVPAVVPLSQVMACDAGGLVLDAGALVDVVQTADHLVEKAEAIALGASGKMMVRQQVKAEIKSLLTDDAYEAAYRQHGSYRKAADALTEQTGQTIGKDKVRRAVERRGGRAEVMAKEDSPSVARGVASQRRDRSKKFLQRR